jgi:hypothetical protein
VDEAAGEPPRLPSDPAVRAVVLEHLHYSDRKHIAEIKQLTDRVLQVVETNQQLQGQTNTLYNQFQDALKQSGGLKALVVGTETVPSSSPHQAHVERAEVINSDSTPLTPSRPATPTAKRNRSKPKSLSSKSDANRDLFPTFRRIAHFLTRK